MCSVCEPKRDGDEPDGDACVGLQCRTGCARSASPSATICWSTRATRCARTRRASPRPQERRECNPLHQLHGRRAYSSSSSVAICSGATGALLQVDRLDWRRRCRPTLSDRASRPSRPRDLNLPTSGAGWLSIQRRCRDAPLQYVNTSYRRLEKLLQMSDEEWRTVSEEVRLPVSNNCT